MRSRSRRRMRPRHRAPSPHRPQRSWERRTTPRPVRVDSPGNGGSVSQSNAVGSGAVAGNLAGTSQTGSQTAAGGTCSCSWRGHPGARAEVRHRPGRDRSVRSAPAVRRPLAVRVRRRLGQHRFPGESRQRRRRRHDVAGEQRLLLGSGTERCLDEAERHAVGGRRRPPDPGARTGVQHGAGCPRGVPRCAVRRVERRVARPGL